MYTGLVCPGRGLPADVLPARPALWLADALLTGVMTRDSMPVRGLYEFCFAKPGSMTYLHIAARAAASSGPALGEQPVTTCFTESTRTICNCYTYILSSSYLLDAIYCEGCLCNVGGQHNLASSRGCGLEDFGLQASSMTPHCQSAVMVTQCPCQIQGSIA